MDKNQYYAITGRFHGDEEDIALPVSAASRDDAVSQFKEDPIQLICASISRAGCFCTTTQSRR